MAHASVKSTHQLTANSSFGRALLAAAAPEAQRRLQEACDAVVEETNRIITDTYVTDRSADRRHPGRHLLGSIYCKVEGAQFPFVLTMGSLAPRVKVNSLNNGSRAHTIQGQPVLAFPPAGNNARFAAASFGRKQVVPKVSHPGTKGSHFLERGMETGVRRVLHAAVTIPRR